MSKNERVTLVDTFRGDGVQGGQQPTSEMKPPTAPPPKPSDSAPSANPSGRADKKK